MLLRDASPLSTVGVSIETSYDYVRGEQADKELVWVSPMWVKYDPSSDGRK